MRFVVDNFIDMKAITFLLLFSFFEGSGQGLKGKYKDYFGNTLELSKGSTFKIEWRFDLIYNWSTGNWTFSNNVLNLDFVNIYDTLIRTNQPDTLVLSIDLISSAIDEAQFAESALISGGQYQDGFPHKLKKSGKRLYLVNHKGKKLALT